MQQRVNNDLIKYNFKYYLILSSYNIVVYDLGTLLDAQYSYYLLDVSE